MVRNLADLDGQVGGGLDLQWIRPGADETSLFLKDEGFREVVKQGV